MDLLLDNNRVHFVQNGEDLASAVRTLSRAKEIAVDTESDSLFVYYEKTCLIQFTADRQNYVIDPLETGDLSALGDLFADPGILKIFHAAEYDLMCLKRDYGFTFENLFDTMVAARILGKPEVGLGGLLANEFDIHLEKKYQKANWGLRPLSQEMLTYAANDTIYLGMLKDRLEEELVENEMMELAREDFLRECSISAGSSEPQMTNWWRITGSQELNSSQTSLLHNLILFRESAAQKRDLPPYKVASNDALLQIALRNPQTKGELQAIRGIGPAFVQRYGRDVLQLIRDNRGIKDYPQPPVLQRPPNGILKRKERLKNWRRDTGLAMNLPSDEILPKEIMESIGTAGPATSDELAELMKSIPVRFRMFGNEILRISLDTEDEGE